MLIQKSETLLLDVFFVSGEALAKARVRVSNDSFFGSKSGINFRVTCYRSPVTDLSMGNFCKFLHFPKTLFYTDGIEYRWD